MDSVNFIKMASPAFAEPAPVKTGGGQAYFVFRNDLTAAEQILF
jgi:hypothetical protein